MKDIEFRSVLGFENVRTYAKFKESLDKDYDFVLVDGPNGSNGISRPDIMEHPEVLSKDAVVIVHDTDRIAEKTMVDRLTDIIHPKTVLQFNRCTVVSMLTDISGLNRLNEGQPKT